MVHTILGSSWLPAWFLSELSPSLARGKRVYWIDVGNRFDAYGLSRTARDRGLDARNALAGVKLARPFNVYQLETMVRAKLPAVWRGETIVLSDPLAPFLDEDLPISEVERIFPRVLEGMRLLPAHWIVLGVERKISPERRALETALLEESDGVARFSEVNGPLSLASLGLDPEFEEETEETTFPYPLPPSPVRTPYAGAVLA
ncbi:MAG: hypothetical protein AUJ52_08270 [Elusimicrobia bacterium CG1_02_63_36]|nr:MAG: hypothetical protein AUJ52_08270 [Elusimicrobia bacterium CG1_02_63_36]PIP81674.1 MAG: hypothetical protein COR54_18940 [Elusimicrobia bacterium CG22_combo_CG10-13_8_21_14_all_63_91]PJA15492.1 MAG: hypothetical protein COX66_10045 [Elusimicrobia bacterium CG_4_10_14_0_2_um_filter_63_34]PJB25189.1 MAG: hypothetical protein CO113_09950 [Elusimicrobia bacterium CG_4_9_14_3_um_filter_62_55]